MAWLSKKWPTFVGIVGFFVVTKLIWNEIPLENIGNSVTDERAIGMVYILLIVCWWLYFIVVAIATWFLANLLKSRVFWLYLAAPIFALWFVSKSVQTALNNLDISQAATGLFVATAVAALPILVGASSHIAKCILSLRNGRGAATGPTVFGEKD